MWDDDQELRAAVLAELDTAPPAAGGGLADVVRRGRGRRRARHAGTALAVVALLTATGAAATALDGDPAPPAGPGPVTTAPADADWPRADLPAQTPYDVWKGSETAPPPADRTVTPYPLCSIPDDAHDRLAVHRATDDVREKVPAALQAAAPNLRVGVVIEEHLWPDRPEKREGWSYAVDVSDRDGTGSVRFEIGDYTGTPLAAADAQAFDVGNCAPPKRHVLADGTVLQLYETRPSEPFQSLTQVLRIFLPDGRLYQVVVQNWGGPDLEADPEQPGSPIRVGAGRVTLPLTEAQLAETGLALLR